jgi:hypothetical protein
VVDCFLSASSLVAMLDGEWGVAWATPADANVFRTFGVLPRSEVVGQATFVVAPFGRANISAKLTFAKASGLSSLSWVG